MKHLLPQKLRAGLGVLAVTLMCSSVTHAQSFYVQSACDFAPLGTAGTVVCLSDDAVSGAVPLGFTFDFYGAPFTQGYISSNGFFTFTPFLSSGCCSGQLLPNGTYTNTIFLGQEDWDPNSCIDGDITYYTTGDPGSRIFVLSYVNVPHYPGPEGVFPITVQLQLYEGTNEIRIVTTEMNGDGGNHTMGLNHNGTEADVVPGRNSQNWSAFNECISFTEFVASPIDGGVIGITSPVGAVDLFVESITVTIENFGSESISDFPVSYSVDGGATVTETYTGTIAAGATASYTFAATYDFTADGCYDITAYTSVDGDGDAGNDNYTGTVCNLGPITGTGAMYIYSNTTGGEPWFSTSNTTAMNTAFGPEGTGWTRAFFETVDVGTAFSPDNCFIFLEGSDSHANELETFLSANITTIENWVASGGKLLLNSAPNEGDGMSFGFGGTSLVYAYYTGTAIAVNPAHPIFNGPNLPVGTSWTGSSFGHARISGTGLDFLIADSFSPTNYVLAEKAWGDGMVVFGGMTTNNFHSPLTEAANLRANILSYLGCATDECPAPTGLMADAITGTSAHLSWDASDNSGGYRLSVYTLDEEEVLKAKVLGGATEWTVTGLTPGTDYAYHVRSICVGLGVASDLSDNYYFSTPLRIGDAMPAVAMYPNPNTGVFAMNVNGYNGNAFSVTISNSTGQVVYSQMVDVNADNFVWNVDLSHAAAGMYQVSMTNEAHQLYYPVIITK